MLKDMFVKPLTFFNQGSLVEHIGGGVPDVFISHAWGGSFKNFVTSVLAHWDTIKEGRTKDNTYYWVCTFGVNQHNADVEVGDTIYGPFWYGLQFAPMGAISIQDDKKAESLFTGLRAWCIFELAVAGTFHKDW